MLTNLTASSASVGLDWVVCFVRLFAIFIFIYVYLHNCVLRLRGCSQRPEEGIWSSRNVITAAQWGNWDPKSSTLDYHTCLTSEHLSSSNICCFIVRTIWTQVTRYNSNCDVSPTTHLQSWPPPHSLHLSEWQRFSSSGSWWWPRTRFGFPLPKLIISSAPLTFPVRRLCWIYWSIILTLIISPVFSWTISSLD